MPLRRLKNLKVIVTGGSSGIGRALSLQLASAGSHVLAVARREQRLDELSSQFASTNRVGNQSTSSGSLSTLVADITVAEDRQRCYDWCQRQWGGLDVLINNAGSGAIGRFDASSADRIRKVMEVDFFAPVELTRLLLPLLSPARNDSRPAIVMVGSVLAHRAVPLKSEYCAAKFALRGWAESLRCELANQKIDVLQVDPSTTRSEFFESLIDTPKGTKSKSIGSMSPERVARITLHALEKSKRRTIISLGGRALVTASRWFPGILDRILSK